MIRLLHVHSPLRSVFEPGRLFADSRFSPESDLDAYLRRRRQAYLADLVQRLAADTEVPVQPIFLQGREVVDSLVAAVRETDLVVMATHGRGPLGRFWFGSITKALMRRSSTPLLLVRGRRSPVDLADDPLIRHVLIPLDDTMPTDRPLESILTLGSLMGADHHTLLRVVSGLPAAVGEPAGNGELRPPHLEADFEEERDHLRYAINRLHGHTPRVHRHTLYEPTRSAASAVLEYARTSDVDLIALAPSSRRDHVSVFLNNVADLMIQKSSLPVLAHGFGEPPGRDDEGRISGRFPPRPPHSRAL